MGFVILTALGVGGATMLGGVVGFLFRNLSRRFSDLVLSFAAGVMLAAAIMGLVLPGLTLGGRLALLWSVGGIFCGALCMCCLEQLIPHLHRLLGAQDGSISEKARLNRVMLFVSAIAIHNLPEGLAAGVGFGTGDHAQALLIAAGIALQNVPEGMVIIAPMLGAGINPRRTLLCALLSGMVEIIGTVLGYLAITVSTAVLPFSLAFAGGTMLYVICDEMIPDTHAHGCGRSASWSLLAGFCLMLVFDTILGG